jgi:hypothetical protein
MRPGSQHFVAGFEDTFIVGGHFYSKECFSRTLDAITIEHFYGESVTNADHSYSVIILFKLLQSYNTILLSKTTQEGTYSSSSLINRLTYNLLEPFPTQKELASLVLTVLYLDQLPPETEENLAAYPWHQTSDFAHDIELARGMARSVCFQARELDGNFANIFKDRERSFIDLCNNLSATKEMSELAINDEKFAESIFGLKIVEEEDTSSAGESESEDSEGD